MAKKIKIYDLNLEYETDYRSIKYPRLEFKTGKLLLVLPKNYGEEKNLIEKHKEWIYKKSLIIDLAKKEAKNKKIKPIHEKRFKDLVVNLAKKFSKEMDVKINKIYFKNLKSKWASCTPKRNLTFNILARYLPKSLIKYIVLHEIVHLKEKKHNAEFWKLIARKFRDYERKEKELLAYWFYVRDLI